MGNQAVMFDLDGTLADTLRDLAAAGNHMLAAFDREPLAPEHYRELVGHGAPSLASRALGLAVDDPRVGVAVDQFRTHLLEHEHVHSVAYPEVPAMLDALVARGVTLAVLSNKPDDSTVDLVKRVFARWPFVDVRGHREGVAPKPDPTAALEIAREAGIAPQRWLYVGDSGVDMRTGHNAGMRSVGVTWGFREQSELRDAQAHHIIHTPMELIELVEGT